LSLVLGRKLGLTASLINVIVPVITLLLYIVFILSLFGTISSAITRGITPFNGFPGLLGSLTLAFIALGIVGLIGIILFLVSMSQLSRYYSEPRIFKNALYGFLTAIIGAVVLIVLVFASLFATIFAAAANSPSRFSPFGVIATLLFVGIGAFVVIIVSAVFYKRAFDRLAEKSGVHNFNTAGTLYLIGQILTIILVGALIVWIAWIFSTLGFNSLKPKAAETSTYAYSAPPTTTAPSVPQLKYCQYCGARNALDAVYCVSCGKQLQPNT